MARPIVAWSFSALESYRNCPRKYWAVKIAKKCSDINKQNSDGDDGHQAFDQYLTKQRSLPAHLAQFTPILERVRVSPGQLYSEYQMALRADYVPCSFKDWDNCWVRAVTDVLVVNGQRAKTIDWKFGKPRKDPAQMELLSAVIFRHFPDVQTVDAAYMYVNHGKLVPYTFHRTEEQRLWMEFLPDVRKLEQSITKDDWPATPNPLCAWCPYDGCAHNTNPELRGEKRA